MDELYSLEKLNLREIKALRKGLEFIQINGVDAMFIGMLQAKLSQQIEQIENQISDNKKSSSKPS
mgnify:FL=1|jgi:hypothetical protein|tara:strand:- start:194 stop:388 length:195 start_codon:yes stop_codon:yes gene_type:complete